MLTFQHEFGHAAFSVGDEYGGTEGTYSGGDPNWPNLSIATTAAGLKWNQLLTSGVSIPTLGNPPNCSQKDSRSNPVSDSTVGSYAGGIMYSCGIFHPQYICVMNDQSDADGNYCTVCLHEATRMLARSAPLVVPALGSIYYAPVSQAWSNVRVAANVIGYFGDLRDYSSYQAVLTELLASTAGTAVQVAFVAAGHAVPNDLEVVQAYYDAGTSEGLWYLISRSTLDTYFVHAYQVSIASNLQTGKIKLPDFPGLTLFDGAVVGTQINLFSCDGGSLSYGVLDASGNLVGAGMVVQTVPGLNQNVTGLSVDYVKSRIWVAVVDQLNVKIATYELISAKWWSQGFITMPVSSPTDFHSVKIVLVENAIHVIAQAARGLYYNTFDTITGVWKGSAAITPITASIAYYDIGTDGNIIYLIANTASSTLSYTYTVMSRVWSLPTDVTAAIGLLAGSAVSSLGVAALGKNLYVIALVDQLAEYAIYNIPSNTWTKSLTAIQPLQSLSGEMGAMMVHATPSQVYVGLSEIDQP